MASTGVPTATAAEQTVDAARSPYPPGWPHLLLKAMERLPGPTWIACVAIGLAVALVTHLPAWSRGDAPVGRLDPTSSYWGLLAGRALPGAAAAIPARLTGTLARPEASEVQEP